MANKSVNKIGKDFDKVVADMAKMAKEYASASGNKKQDLLKKLKDLTAKKKDLKSQLERAVMDADKYVTLQIDERYMKIALTSMIGRLVEQEISAINEEDDDAEVKELEKAMADGFKGLEAALNSMGDEARADVEKVNESVIKRHLKEKGELNEEVSTLFILGIILAAPKIVELFTKGLSKLVRTFKKVLGGDGKEDPEGTAAKIIKFTHKWHKGYIKAIRWILKVTGVFKKAGITDKANQMKAASMLYYTLIAGLAIYSGVGAVSAFKSAMASSGASAAGGFSLSAFEAAMATIKSGEVAEFLGELGLAGTAGA